MTKAQRALNDLEIILDDAGLEHDEIIQGWINKIAAELATNAALLAALENARIALTFYRERMEREEPGTTYPFGVDAETAARTAIEEATP